MNTQASRRLPDDLPSDEEFFLIEKAPQETPVSNPHRPFASETPGAQIKAIREAQNVSIDEVAKRLYLDVQMVRNLETDNYAHLPPPIFVQGYLKAFAKLFNVSEEPLLAAYLKYNPNANNPPVLASENTAQMPKVGISHDSSRWWYYMTGVLLLGLTVLIAWRYAMQSQAPRTETPPVENASASAITPPNTSINSTPYTPPSESGGAKPSTTTPTTPTAGTTSPPPVAMTSLPPVAGSQSTPPATVGTTPTSTTTTTTTPPTNTTTPTTDAGTTPTPPVVAPAEDTAALILKFKDVSWAKVTDSKKKKLYDGTSKPGQTVTIKEGEPPYEISLNKVTTVDLFYKGQLMDLKPFKDQRTATLTVGDAPKGSASAQEEEEEE